MRRQLGLMLLQMHKSGQGHPMGSGFADAGMVDVQGLATVDFFFFNFYFLFVCFPF